MIKVKGLRKKFDDCTALNNFCMHVRRGSIYGLVGANGAGKTPVLKTLAGVYKPDHGIVEIDGKPVYDNADVKSRIFFMPDDLGFFSDFTLGEAERFFRSFHSAWDRRLFKELIEALHLEQNQGIDRLSKGKRKQTAFAIAMSCRPKTLILDEPVDGLDPFIRKTIRSYIIDATAEREMTTILSSHNLREVETVCDTVGILSEGRMILEKDTDALRENIYKILISFAGRPADEREGLLARLNILYREPRGGADLIIVGNRREELDAFYEREDPLLFDIMQLSLEEIFLHKIHGGEEKIHEVLF